MKKSEIFTVKSIDNSNGVVNVVNGKRQKHTFKIEEIKFIGFNKLHCKLK